jgi:hypothetical protein
MDLRQEQCRQLVLAYRADRPTCNMYTWSLICCCNRCLITSSAALIQFASRRHKINLKMRVSREREVLDARLGWLSWRPLKLDDRERERQFVLSYKSNICLPACNSRICSNYNIIPYDLALIARRDRLRMRCYMRGFDRASLNKVLTKHLVT